MTDNFRTGKGIPWGEHASCLFEGKERFFRPGYAANLTSSWLPALEGVEGKLKRGARGVVERHRGQRRGAREIAELDCKRRRREPPGRSARTPG